MASKIDDPKRTAPQKRFEFIALVPLSEQLIFCFTRCCIDHGFHSVNYYPIGTGSWVRGDGLQLNVLAFRPISIVLKLLFVSLSSKLSIEAFTVILKS